MAPVLPPIAPFPADAGWRQAVGAAAWRRCVTAWLALARAHLALNDGDFAAVSMHDASLARFLASAVHGLATEGLAVLGDDDEAAAALKKAVYCVVRRALPLSHGDTSDDVDMPLLTWTFAADLSRAYGRRRAGQVLQGLPAAAAAQLEASLAGLKRSMEHDLDRGRSQGKGRPGSLAAIDTAAGHLRCVNHLVDAWPAAAALLLAGSDYTDALVAGFHADTDPTQQAALQRIIVTHLFLCLVGLTDERAPRFAQLVDVLYLLGADADGLVQALVHTTPVLALLQRRAAAAPASPATRRMANVLQTLQKHQTAGRGPVVPAGRRRATLSKDKGKARANDGPDDGPAVDRLNHITQIQDLFPDLGAGFVARLLDAYGEDPERAIQHLLEDTLPPHLATADRSEALTDGGAAQPSPPPPLLQPPPYPSQAAIAPGLDDVAELTAAVQRRRLHVGKRPGRTADEALRQRPDAPQKAAILAALAVFDADDDERDDTYDADDVGGTVDAATTAGGGGGGGGDDGIEARDETLFAAFTATPDVFARDAATRRSTARAQLRDETGLTDEALEGWGLMLTRNPQQRRRLEARLATFTGAQAEVARTAWREGASTDDADEGGGRGRGGGGRGRGRGRGGGPERGGGSGGGSVAGPTGEKSTEQARRRKEASKSSRANHNRRDQRARKMGGGMG